MAIINNIPVSHSSNQNPQPRTFDDNNGDERWGGDQDIFQFQFIQIKSESIYRENICVKSTRWRWLKVKFYFANKSNVNYLHNTRRQFGSLNLIGLNIGWMTTMMMMVEKMKILLFFGANVSKLIKSNQTKIEKKIDRSTNNR